MGSERAGADTGAAGSRRSPFARAEHVLAHAVYGLLLTLATLGELIDHHVSSRTAVAWLLGTGAVLLAAHLFSDLLARAAATGHDPDWSEVVSIGRTDLAVAAGAVASAAIMAVAGLLDLDTDGALIACVLSGLAAVATLSFLATPEHRTAVRVVLGGGGALLGALIVLLENTL